MRNSLKWFIGNSGSTLVYHPRKKNEGGSAGYAVCAHFNIGVTILQLLILINVNTVGNLCPAGLKS